MTPTAILLLPIILLAFFIPLAWACEQLHALGWKVPILPKLYELLGRKHYGQTEEARGFSINYKELEKGLLKQREYVFDCLNKEKLLTRELENTKRKQQFLKDKKSNKRNEVQLEKKFARLELKCIQLQRQTTEQKAATEFARKQLQDMETDVNQSFAAKQGAVAKSKAEAVNQTAKKILAETDASQALNVLDKMEQAVAAREAKVQKIFKFNTDAVKPLSPSAAEWEVLNAISYGVSAIVNSFDLIKQKVLKADPSTERAYKRLQEKWKLSVLAFQNSQAIEDSLEDNVHKHNVALAAWLERREKAMALGDGEVAENALRRTSQYKLAIDELTKALNSQRQKNLLIGQQLYKNEGIVIRLQMLKLLISTLPNSQKEEIQQFRKIVNALYEYMRREWSEKTSADAQVNLIDSINMLEQRALMLYINITKNSFEERFSLDVSILAKRIEKALPSLELTLARQRSEFDRWDKTVRESIEDQKDLLNAFASQRRDQCASLTKIVERNIDALTLLVNLNESKSTRLSSADS